MYMFMVSDAIDREQQRVAVGRGVGDRRRAGGAAGAAAVLDHDRLPERFAQRSRISRAMASVEAPGGNGTTMVIGRFG